MSKMTDYQAGREDGLLLAEKIVKEGGLESLQEEIRYRGITQVHTQLAKKEIEKATIQIKLNTLDTVLLLAVSTIRDEFEFGAKRLKRLIERMERKSTCLLEDMATWEDFRKQMEEETGIEINVTEARIWNSRRKRNTIRQSRKTLTRWPWITSIYGST